MVELWSKREKTYKALYFFIKFQIDQGVMEVENCPPEKMWLGVLNKKKQHTIFREFKGEIMNVELNYGDKVESNNTSDRIAGVLLEE